MIQKKTQAERVDHRLIMAWVCGQENISLAIQEVLDRYVPPDLKGSAQYFTSLETGTAALERLRLRLAPGQKLRVLEPCAGIGHLIYLLRRLRAHLIVDAYEVEAECVQVGRKLFPWVNWFAVMPFLTVADLEGRYDLVLCNPPIGTRRGMDLARQACDGRCAHSEYTFLDLSIRALKPGGQAVVLGPETFLKKRPARLQTWLEGQVERVDCLGPLPGPPTSIKLYAYYFHKAGDPGGRPGRRVSLASVNFKQLYSKGDASQ